MSSDLTEEMRTRFRALNLNDCRLVRVSIERGVGQQADDVILLIEMVPGLQDVGVPLRELRFRSCRDVRLSMDLVGKAEMGDQLADCECRPASGGAWLDPNSVSVAGDRSDLTEFVIHLANFSRSKIRVVAGSYEFAVS